MPEADALAKHHVDVKCHWGNNYVEIVAIARDTDDDRSELVHVLVVELKHAKRNAQQCNESTESCKKLAPGCKHVAIPPCKKCICPPLLKCARFC